MALLPWLVLAPCCCSELPPGKCCRLIEVPSWHYCIGYLLLRFCDTHAVSRSWHIPASRGWRELPAWPAAG